MHENWGWNLIISSDFGYVSNILTLPSIICAGKQSGDCKIPSRYFSKMLSIPRYRTYGPIPNNYKRFICPKLLQYCSKYSDVRPWHKCICLHKCICSDMCERTPDCTGSVFQLPMLCGGSLWRLYCGSVWFRAYACVQCNIWSATGGGDCSCPLDHCHGYCTRKWTCK